MGMEYKTVGATIKKAEDDGSFEAVITTFGVVDKDRDIVERGAFTGHPVHVLPAHKQQHVPLGKAVIKEHGDKAVAVGQFNLEIQAAVEWHSALQFDLTKVQPAIQEWSYGFKIKGPEGARLDSVDGVPVRRIIMIDEREISPVLRGASVGTGTLSIKSEAAHKTETSDEPWDAPIHERRLTAGAKDSGAYALVQGDQGHFLHHEVCAEGSVGPASVRACVAGIAALKGARGASMLTGGSRQGVYDHLASHLRDAGVEPPELGDKPGIKLTDQILLATWDAEAVLARITGISADRELGQEAKAAAMELASRHAELMKKFEALAEGMLPDDAAMRAAATFLAGGGIID